MSQLDENNYKFIKKIGEGVFSKVFLVENNFKQQFALKQVKFHTKKGYLESGLKEIEIHKNFKNKSKFIIDLLGYFYCSNNQLHILFEKMDMNLYNYQKKFNPDYNDSMYIMYQVSLGVKYIHQYIIHKDLKHENIMINVKNKKIKIIDFGSSEFNNIKDNHKKTYIVTRYYRAPEIVYGCGYNFTIDIWSLGCILFELICDFPLFKSSCEQDLVYKISELIGIPDLNRYHETHKFDKFWVLKPNHNDNMYYYKNDDYQHDPISFDYEFKHSLMTEKIKYTTPRKFKLKPYLYNELKKKIKTKLHLKFTVNFLAKILIYDFEKRPTAEDCITDLIFLETKLNTKI